MHPTDISYLFQSIYPTVLYAVVRQVCLLRQVQSLSILDTQSGRPGCVMVDVDEPTDIVFYWSPGCVGTYCLRQGVVELVRMRLPDLERDVQKMIDEVLEEYTPDIHESEALQIATLDIMSRIHPSDYAEKLWESFETFLSNHSVGYRIFSSVEGG